MVDGKEVNTEEKNMWSEENDLYKRCKVHMYYFHRLVLNIDLRTPFVKPNYFETHYNILSQIWSCLDLWASNYIQLNS